LFEVVGVGVGWDGWDYWIVWALSMSVAWADMYVGDVLRRLNLVLVYVE
jgi:hypothetical protein